MRALRALPLRPMNDVRVRFAPSPTGPLHMGGVRTALYNWLFARAHGGTFILRIEDTDQGRFVEDAEAYIEEALAWCGLTPDEGVQAGGDCGPYRQSERTALYQDAVQTLLDQGLAYEAFDTPEELNALRKAAEPDVWQYDATTRGGLRNSLALGADEVAQLKADGVPFVVRFKTPEADEAVVFEDAIRGEVSFQTAVLDDKVLMKADGLPTYHLANVVDDHHMRISHVIRGEEWLPSAPLHVLLYRAFGWDHPVFAHLPLILKPTGNGKLSKRDGDAGGFPVFPTNWTDPKSGDTWPGYREQGYAPEAFVNMLLMLGWNPGDERELFSAEEAAKEFSYGPRGQKRRPLQPRQGEVVPRAAPPRGRLSAPRGRASQTRLREGVGLGRGRLHAGAGHDAGARDLLARHRRHGLAPRRAHRLQRQAGQEEVERPNLRIPRGLGLRACSAGGLQQRSRRDALQGVFGGEGTRLWPGAVAVPDCVDGRRRGAVDV